jgi:hypothetical protein
MPKSMKSQRGFAVMKSEMRSRIASLGGKAAHASAPLFTIVFILTRPKSD